jgi:hypothetical protein
MRKDGEMRDQKSVIRNQESVIRNLEREQYKKFLE